eukprot:6327480-Amphidinium_carterae.1
MRVLLGGATLSLVSLVAKVALAMACPSTLQWVEARKLDSTCNHLVLLQADSASAKLMHSAEMMVANYRPLKVRRTLVRHVESSFRSSLSASF